MPRPNVPRNLLAALLGVAAALLFVRLGIWQLRRLAERRARNAQVAARMAAPPAGVEQLSRDTAAAHYRRVRVRGVYDFDHEIVLTGRSSEGSPGVNLITPLHPAGGGPAVLINRGWAYSPDATTIDPTKWREPDSATVTGYVEEFTSGRGEAHPRAGSRAWRFLDGAQIARAMPYPITPFYIVQVANPGPHATSAGSLPVRLSTPSLDEGPHRSYAIQWFAFAAIAIFGVAYLIWQDSRDVRGR